MKFGGSIKQEIAKYALIIIEWFSKKKNKAIKSLPYIPLSPTDSAEDCDVYFEAITWALANKKQIKNIAISGPYGSGKSSILQTFIKREQQPFKNRKWFSGANHFLNISLAKFKAPEANYDGNENNNIQRLIELSLLQQLFYRETNSKTPDSRLTKIHRLKSWNLLFQSIIILVFILSAIIMFTPDKLDTFFEFDGFSFSYAIIKYSALTIFLLILFGIIYRSSRSIISLSIKKLNLQGTEIEIDKKISKSILNNHIDEIIYFFEATNYNVVIIEDLDRFGNSEVFTKLREINLLINNSKKITRDIVFIYAIKDDMFYDKDRAKFFDFMIPVIPIVNFSNSGDKLKNMLKDSSKKIDNDLIEDLSLFIDDMRLLYNIMNEFHIYATKVSTQLDMNKLLAIIVYKNLYPKDFTELSENSGDLFNTINNKNKYIQETISEIDKQIESIKERIRISEETIITNIKDLRTLYISRAVEGINNRFMGFKVGDTNIALLEFADDKYFKIIKSGKIEYYYYDSDRYGRSSTSYSFNFSEIEKQVHPTQSYAQRESAVLDRNRINQLKKEIEKLNVSKDDVRKSRLKDLLSKGKISICSQQIKKKELIDILLRNGYINENYLDYISIFHEGTLSKTDYQFLINVKRELNPQFDYVLNKKEELIKRISLYMFEKECILNFDIVDTLLKCNLKDKIDTLFQQLGNEHELTISFINEYIDRSKEQGTFVRELCFYWQNIWRYIITESNFTNERKEHYFLLILKYASIKDLEKIFNENDPYIANYHDFFIIDMDAKVRRNLVKSLGINFKTLNPNSPKEDIQFIMDNNYYEINREMIKVIIPEEIFNNTEGFYTKNYSFLRHLGLDLILNYIEKKINTYVEEILIGIEDNTKEEIEEYTLLLNNSDLELELKEKLIQKMDTIINDITTIDGLKESHLLFQNSKVKPTWENIQAIFEKDSNTISESTILFFNNKDIATILSQSRMTSEPNEDGVKVYSKLCKAIINSKDICDDSYCLLLRSIPWWYDSFETNSISQKRMSILIANNIVRPTIESYNYLLQNYKGLNIRLIEINSGKFIELLDQTKVDLSDMEILLNSSKLNEEVKFKFINSVDDSIIINSNFNSNFVLKNVLLHASKYSISETLQFKLVKKKNLPVTERINLFFQINNNLNNEEINSFLISLGIPYSEIPNNKKSTKIERNAINEKLMKILIDRKIISSYSDKNDQVYHSTKNKEQ